MVKIHNAKSSEHYLYAGVPQGSVLSPTLFNIMINDIFEDIPKEVQTSLFADDSALWIVSNDLEEATTIMQSALDHITEWSCTWGLTISSSKSQALIITRRRTPLPEPLKIQEEPICRRENWET